MYVDLIVTNIGELITCASNGKPKRGQEMLDLSILTDGAIAVKDGVFVAVGYRAEIEKAYDSKETVDARGRVACPGFVDPHTHIVFAGDRLDEFELKIKGADYLEILAGGGGIISTVRETRSASVEHLVEEGLKRLDKMLACGTTTCEIKTGYGLNTETELKMLRVIERLDKDHPTGIVPTFLAAHAVPPEFTGNTDGYVDLICEEMLPKAWAWYTASHFADKKTSFFVDVFTERNAFDVDQSRRILQTASGFGFSMKAHVDEFTNLGGSRLAIEMGATSVDHLDVISDEEVEQLAESNTIGIVTPTVNFNFGSTHFADARKLIDAGCAVALSTDYNPGSAPCPSQQMAMAIACRYQKLFPAEAMNAATINAAFSVGLGKTHGSIEAGKQADLLILSTNDHREIAYEFGGNIVEAVVKDGNATLQNS